MTKKPLPSLRLSYYSSTPRTSLHAHRQSLEVLSVELQILNNDLCIHAKQDALVGHSLYRHLVLAI